MSIIIISPDNKKSLTDLTNLEFIPTMGILPLDRQNLAEIYFMSTPVTDRSSAISDD